MLVEGPLAQLVERHVYTVDVIGSSPVGPTRTLESVMDNERSQWHSDDELASALERALEITHTGAIPVVQPAPATGSNESIGDLFAALVDEPANEVVPSVIAEERWEDVASTPAQEPREQVYESLDDFKPRTNFIPVQQPVTESVSNDPAPPTSAAVTMPVQWTPERLSFDEVVFGVSSSA